MNSNFSFPLFCIFLSGCVTGSGQNDCFDFGVNHCVSFYAKLSEEERSSERGTLLKAEICAHPELRCVDEPGDHIFPVKLKMAREGYSNLTLSSGSGRVSGIFQKAGNDKSMQQRIEGTIATAGHIEACDKGTLESCEKIMSRSSWGVKFDAFFQQVPSDASRRARARLCKSKNYKCLSFDNTKPFETPAGWTLVENSTTSTVANGKRSEHREVILKRQ